MAENGTNELPIKPDMREMSDEVFWKQLTTRYWYFILILGLIIVGAIVGFVLTIRWFVYIRSPFGGNGTWTFDQFSLRSAILYMIYFILWELLLVGLPALAAAGIVVGLAWFVFFPEDLKAECKLRGKKAEIEEEVWKKKYKKKHGSHRSSQGSGAFGFFVFVGLCIYVAVEGNWNTPFGSLNIGYFVDRWITVFLWGLVIIGIPALVFGLLWYWKKFGVEE